MASLAARFTNDSSTCRNNSKLSQKNSGAPKKHGTGIPRRKLSSTTTATTTNTKNNKFKVRKTISNNKSAKNTSVINKSKANSNNSNNGRKVMKKNNNVHTKQNEKSPQIDSDGKREVVYNIDKRARRINAARLFTKGIKTYRAKHPFQPKCYRTKFVAP